MSQFTIQEQLQKLESIQQIDLKIDLLKKAQKGLPGAVQKWAQFLAQSQTQLSEKLQKIEILRAEVSQTQAALDLGNARLEKNQAQLSRLKTSQEFQAAVKEADQLKKMTDTLLEQLRQIKGDLESLETASSLMVGELQASQVEQEGELKELTEKNQVLEKEIQAFQVERKTCEEGLGLQLLNQYQRVRNARNGVGLSSVSSGRCQACNMIIPPQMDNEIQKGSVLHSCPSCQRILFVEQKRELPIVAPT